MMKNTAAVILAAGLGTRMKSKLAKGLHKAAGMPLIWYPVKAALDAGVQHVVLVVGHQREQIQEEITRLFPDSPISFVVQEEQLGTAHATLCAQDAVQHFEKVVFINGDLPLLTAGAIAGVGTAFEKTGGSFALLTSSVAKPGGFGRIVRHYTGVGAIVEAADATPAQLGIKEVNVGVYMAATDLLFAKLHAIKNENVSGEFYFTDVVAALRADGHHVGAYTLDDETEAHQVNDRFELSTVEALLYARKARMLMLSGVTIHLPETVMVDYDCEIGPDTEVMSGCEIKAGSRIGSGCVVSRGCVIANTVIGDGVTIKPYCIFTDSVIDEAGILGPFSHLRPLSHTMKGAHVGNFVELKKTVLGTGSKANHLTYLGDSVIGAGANIGAGVITCNYDGYNKMTTQIGDGAFIGSDVQLVAPVKVGRNAYVAAGTTVTQDIPEGALAISRVPQKHIEGYAEKKRAKGKKA
jgi:bifunctional UDP-N-acetylglucosamine pyrophosphorylase/glucosamine-1-phosphate N-acetyltransferase